MEEKGGGEKGKEKGKIKQKSKTEILCCDPPVCSEPKICRRQILVKLKYMGPVFLELKVSGLAHV